jgi:hypothetical protein
MPDTPTITFGLVLTATAEVTPAQQQDNDNEETDA